jgi:hypothetical protein
MCFNNAQWTVDNHFGILNWLPDMNEWLFAIVGLLLLDLIGAYLAHLAE